MHFNMLKYSPAAAATHGRGAPAAGGGDRWMTCLSEWREVEEVRFKNKLYTKDRLFPETKLASRQ